MNPEPWYFTKLIIKWMAIIGTISILTTVIQKCAHASTCDEAQDFSPETHSIKIWAHGFDMISDDESILALRMPKTIYDGVQTIVETNEYWIVRFRIIKEPRKQ